LPNEREVHSCDASVHQIKLRVIATPTVGHHTEREPTAQSPHRGSRRIPYLSHSGASSMAGRAAWCARGEEQSALDSPLVLGADAMCAIQSARAVGVLYRSVVPAVRSTRQAAQRRTSQPDLESPL